MKNILFVTTQYRVGERIYPTIPGLSEIANLDLLCLYQMHPSHNWAGDNDSRIGFHIKYDHYFSSIFIEIPNLEKYDLILLDDNRARNSLDTIYSRSKCTVIGCSHGNTDQNYVMENLQKVFDYCFVFGHKEKLKHSFSIPAGIPANDALKNYPLNSNYILVIVNFLGNSPVRLFPVKFDDNFVRKINIPSLHNIYGKLPIVIKLKSRANDGTVEQNVKYVNSIMPTDIDYKILVDVTDDNELIANAAAVISAPSTMVFKALQLKKPTVLIKGSGQTGLFHDYYNLKQLYGNDIPASLASCNYNIDKTEKFIDNTIAGGNDFTSTELFINEIKQFLV